MHRNRARRPLCTWIAALAILMASLLPTLSHALNLGQQISWIEVCGAQGNKWVPAGDAATQAGNAAPVSSLLAHCPGCVGQHDAPGLPPSAAPGLILSSLDQAAPSSLPSPPPSQRDWHAAWSRAPPLHS